VLYIIQKKSKILKKKQTKELISLKI
jgi:hypothetical protein